MENSKKELIISKRYEIIKRLGHGSFGEIYEGRDLESESEVAIKIEPKRARLPQLHYETKVYKCLNGGIGIPKVYKYIDNEPSFNIMILQKLGPSLEDFFNFCQRKFTLKTVLMLADQMIRRLEYVHDRCLLHRDIKPDNFLFGTKTNSNRVYLIDFGLAKKFYDKTKDIHISYRDSKPLTGTARYASINTHFGIEQSRRDDLESLGYVFLYFLRGSLPWQGLHAKGRNEKYNLIAEKKVLTSTEELCEGFPEEFGKYLNYCRSLKFEEMPDYAYLRKLFHDVFVRHGYSYDFKWDWLDGPHSVKNNKIFKSDKFGS